MCRQSLRISWLPTKREGGEREGREERGREGRGEREGGEERKGGEGGRRGGEERRGGEGGRRGGEEKEGGEGGEGEKVEDEERGKLCSGRCRILAFYLLSPASTGSQYLGNRRELCTETKRHFLIPKLHSNHYTNSYTTFHSILSFIPRPSNAAGFKVNFDTYLCMSSLLQNAWVQRVIPYPPRTRCLSSARSRQTL